MIIPIVCGYKCEDSLDRCLRSLQMQTAKHRAQIYVDREYNRKYLLGSTVDAIKSAKPADDDIIACVDADDFLCDDMAFEIVQNVYNGPDPVLLTYGSYVTMQNNKRGKFCGPYEPGENVRTAPWRASHLKTFKYKLFKQIPDGALRDADGEYYKCCADRALMIPMMEMAGLDRCTYINMMIYCYDDKNPLGVWRTMRDESIRIRNRIAAGTPMERMGDL